jgi:hypothetical protein
MELATTLQFRKTVRKVLKKAGVQAYCSWTNGAKQVNTPHRRTVGFNVYFGLAFATALIAKIEKKLAKKGLTAMTRYSDKRGAYIRGTCSYYG